MDNTLILQTPLGEIKCILDSRDLYPNLTLHVDDVPVAVLEYHNDQKQIRMMHWETADMDDDDPYIRVYKEGDK